MKTAHFVPLTLVFVLSFFVLARSVSAAAPDGAGPWADAVTSFSQGFTKDGSSVPALRSDPAAALGVAEDDTAEGHFVSLGFGGVLTLRFDNPVRTGVLVFEATNPNYPAEKATISVSADGVSWTSAGSISQDGQVSLPEGITCAKYVKITDTSIKEDFVEGSADAYDVDGVKAVGTEPCSNPTPTPSPTPTPTPDGCGPDTNVNISGNGAGSVNKVIKNGSNSTSVVVGAQSKVKTTVKTKAVSGNNKVKNNTGGGVTVTSGSSTSSTTVGTVVGGTTVSVTNSCCGCGESCSHKTE